MVVLHFLQCLAGSKIRHKFPVAVMAFNAALTTTAVFAIGFQCSGSSMVLFSDRCFDQASYSDGVEFHESDLFLGG